MDNNETIGNMVENPKTSLFKMAIPPFVSFGCILLYSFIDSVWISGLGHVEVTAIGITSPIFYLLIIIGTGIGTTVNTTLSKAMAEKNIEKSNSIVKNTVLAIIILSILIPLIILPFLDKILILLCANESFNAAYAYLSILIFFIGIFFISDVFPFLLRLQGYIKIPIYISVITSVLNIILDPIFIYSLHMGIEGAAVSTVISATLGSILLITTLLIKKSKYIALGEYNYNKKRDLEVLKKNLRIGIPIILQSAGSAIFLIIVNTFFIYEGLIYITAYSFANKMLSFLFLPLNAFSASMLSVIGFLIGAGRWDEITPNLKYALYVVEIFTIIPCVFFFHRIRFFKLHIISNQGYACYKSDFFKY